MIFLFSRESEPKLLCFGKKMSLQCLTAIIVKKNLFLAPFFYFFIGKYLIYPFFLNRV